MDVRQKARAAVAGACVLGCAGAWRPAVAIEFSYSGYVRQHLSVNLQDAPERAYPIRSGEFLGNATRDTPESFDTLGGKGELSMARTTLKLDGLLDLGFAQVVAVGRSVREHHTEYERRLERAATANVFKLHSSGIDNGLLAPFRPDAATAVKAAVELVRDGSGAVTGLEDFLALVESLSIPPRHATLLAGHDAGLMGRPDFWDEYDSDELRELFVQFDVGQKNHFRLGRQQVVWGETDFFRAMDIIHGYDLRWRLFLELENEELRKPLIMASYQRDIATIDGGLQLILRPGWDAGNDVGDQLPLSGGRWSPQPFRGFHALALAPYNYHHCSGDEDDPNYGARLAGVTRQVGWSLNYYRGMSQTPVLNRNPRIGGTPGIGCFESPIGNGENVQRDDGSLPASDNNGNVDLVGQPFEAVFPMIDTFGFTANYYAGGWIDSVLKTEIAFTPNQPYNAGKNTWIEAGIFELGFDDGDNDGVDDIVASNQLYLPLEGGLKLPVNNAVLFGGDNPVMIDTSVGGGENPDGSGLANCWLCAYFPGLREIVEKPTLKIMLGWDKQLYWTPKHIFKTQRPATWLFQVFDTWLMDFDPDEEVLELPGLGATRREHTVYVTNALLLNYKYDTVNPGLAFGFDAGNLDSFMLPFVDLTYGDHWRVHAEASFFLARHTSDQLADWEDRDTRLLGALVNHDQATVRLTYQF